MKPNETQTVVAYLTRPETQRAIVGLAKLYAIPLAEFELLLQSLLDGTVSDSELPVTLQLSYHLADDASYALADKITEELFDPIREHLGRTKLETYPSARAVFAAIAAQEQNLDGVLAEIRRRAGITIRESVLDRRFQNIVFNWFRDVRDTIETREVAKRETRVGGLGFDAAAADRFIEALQSVKNERAAAGTDIVRLISDHLKRTEEVFSKIKTEELEIDVRKPAPAPAAPAVSKVAPIPRPASIPSAVTISLPIKPIPKPANPEGQSRSALAEAETPSGQATRPTVQNTPSLVKRIEQNERVIEAHKELRQPAPAPSTLPPAAPRNVPPSVRQMVQNAAHTIPADLKKQRDAARPTQTPTASFPASVSAIPRPTFIPRPQPQASGRPKMTDVRGPVKLFGPLEELAALTVADFRRLSGNPEESARKITHKLRLLADESLERRAQGIKALQSSPLYAAYASRIQTAMGGGGGTGERLSDAEVHAILELNKSLKN